MLALQAMLRFLDTEDALVLVLLALPVLAVIGGITVGVIRTLGQQRQMELAQRERIAAIERGIDPSKLPAPPPAAGGEYFAQVFGAPAERARHRYQGLLIGGILSIAVGLGMTALFSIVEDQGESWAIGILPMVIGAGLLLCAWIVRPRDDGLGPRA